MIGWRGIVECQDIIIRKILVYLALPSLLHAPEDQPPYDTLKVRRYQYALGKSYQNMLTSAYWFTLGNL